MTVIEAQQQKIDEFIEHSKKLVETTTTEKAISCAPRTTKQERPQDNKKQKRWCKQCQGWVYHSNNTCFALDANKDKRPQWYINKMDKEDNMKGLNQG